MQNYLEFFEKYPKKILYNLIKYKVVDSTIAKKYKDVFNKYSFTTILSYRDIFEENFEKKEKYEGYDNENVFCFSIWEYPNYDPRYSNFLNIKQDILTNFNVLQGGNSRFSIHKSEFESFLERYQNNKEIFWGDICSNKCLYFTNDIIAKYDHILSWEVLQYSGNLEWTFELIESKKEILNWMAVSSYKFLKWDIDKIDKYKDYLIFSLGEPGWKKTSYVLDGKNKRGKWFKLEPRDRQGNLFGFKLKGSISLCETIDWSIPLINKFFDSWDWEELCLNKGIKWDESLIETYIEKVNFKALSSNPSVKWNEKLIEKYKNKWDWEELSINNGITTTQGILSQFEEMWIWKPLSNNRYRDEYKDNNITKCLSSNKTILWNLKIVDGFFDKIDFWRISLNGTIDEEVIIKYANEFERKENCDWEYHRWSDWRFGSDVYKNGWENFLKNRNTKFSIKLIDFFRNYSTQIIYSNGNLAHDGEIIEENISLLKLFKELEFEGLTIDLVIENYENWGEIFFNNNFINEFLIEKYLIPILTEELTISLLENLKNKPV